MLTSPDVLSNALREEYESSFLHDELFRHYSLSEYHFTKDGVELEGGLEDSWEGGFDLVGVFSSDDPFYTALLLFKGIRHPYGVGVVQQNVVIKESGGDVLPFRFIEEDMAFHLCEVLMMYLNE